MLYQTPIGPHDGDSWEALCQVCLKIKFKGDYVEVPASPGDYGVEGFNKKDGEVFQCYCPERECSDKDLYTSQRTKVTKDLNKLKKFEKEITKLLGGTKIKTWYLLTPKVTTNDILFHCANKTDEVKKWNLPFIDPSFEVRPLDYKYLAAEIPTALSMLEYTANPAANMPKIELTGTSIEEDEIEKYKSDLKNSDYTKKAFRKHEIRFEIMGIKDDNRVYTQVDRTVKNLLIGDSILSEWEALHQDQFEKFNAVMDILERNVSDLCAIPTNDPEGRYNEIKKMISDHIDKEFHFLSNKTRLNLSNRVISDWLLRCPLNFE